MLLLSLLQFTISPEQSPCRIVLNNIIAISTMIQHCSSLLLTSTLTSRDSNISEHIVASRALLSVSFIGVPSVEFVTVYKISRRSITKQKFLALLLILVTVLGLLPATAQAASGEEALARSPSTWTTQSSIACPSAARPSRRSTPKLHLCLQRKAPPESFNFR